MDLAATTSAYADARKRTDSAPTSLASKRRLQRARSVTTSQSNTVKKMLPKPRDDANAWMMKKGSQPKKISP
jgi:hypothetical protein